MTVNEHNNPELDIVKSFLKECIPFDILSDKQLTLATQSIQITYHRAGHVIKAQSGEAGLRIMRSGAGELRKADGQLIDRFGEQVSFNLHSLSKEQADIQVVLIEDALIYYLPAPVYQTIRREQRDFDRFFHSQRNRRIRRAARYEPLPQDMMGVIGDMMTTTIHSIAPDATIQQAAQRMTEKRVSSLLVMQADKLLGMLTDRDLRTRVVATALDFNAPVRDIMTTDVQTIDAEKTLFDTTLMMTQSGFHHMPVLDKEKVVGIVTSSDLILSRRNDPVYLVQHIGRQSDVQAVKAIVAKLPDLMVRWTNAGIRVEQVASIFTAVSDAVTARLIELYCATNGAAPVEFAWLGFGSQGRREQLLGGDQDNALLIDDAATEKDMQWFAAMANWVCTSLDSCGYRFCPGNIMASNAALRQTLSAWKQRVNKWAITPTPEAVLQVSIFFDIRVVVGSKTLGDQLQAHMLTATAGKQLFLHALSENVLAQTPPLGIFRQFVVEHDGQHDNELDLKKRGILPIIDIARIHAIANNITAVGTHERLAAFAEQKIISINDSRDLQDAYRIISQIRLNAQVAELMQGQLPNNYINPDNLSKIVRKQLRDAFAIIRDAQQGVQRRYNPGVTL